MAASRPLSTSTGLILRNIMKTAEDSYTITIKKIVRFQERMHLEKFQVDKIQNDRLSAIIHFDRPDIAEYHETAQDIYTITINQIVRFQERMHLKKIQLDQVQNGPISHYSLSHGPYLVNSASWLDH